MKFKTFTLRTNLLSKLLLSLALLLIGGGNISAERHITISGMENTSYYFPFYGSYVNYLTTGSQYIIPKEDISKVKDQTISKIKLYFSTTNKSWSGATFKVYLKEVDYNKFTSDNHADWADLTEVYSGALSIDANGEMLISFSTPFEYSGDNLLVGFNLQTTGSTNSLTCYGLTTSDNVATYSYYSTYGGNKVVTYRQKFLPKTTIYFSGTAEPTSFSASEIAYNSATLSWTAGDSETQWQVYYSATEGEPGGEAELSMVSTTPSKEISGLLPEKTYYAYVRSYINESDQSDWVSTSFTTLEQYPTPTDFALSSYGQTTATFAWTNGLGTTPTSWQLRYSTSSVFNPENSEGVLVDNITSNPYTLTGLTEDITYYASIRAFYGDDNYSGWTDKVAFTPSDIQNLLINDGSTINGNIPQLYYTKNGETKSQFIIPASSLTSIRDRQITTLTFYANSVSKVWSGVTFEVYLKETSNDVYASATLESWGTNVYRGTLSVSSSKMIINLTTPFNYSSNNLMVGFKQVEGKTGSNGSPQWYGLNQGGTSNYVNIYHYSGIYNDTPMRGNFAPKLTLTTQSITTAPVKIDANGYTTFASPWPLNLSAASQSSLGFTAYKATVDAGNSRVLFTSGIDQNVSANTGVLLAGTPSATYLIPVAESGTALADNALLVNDGTLTAESGYTYYALKKNSDPLVFGTFDPSTVVIPSNKAYLKVENEYAVKGLSFEFDNPTAVQSIKEAQPAVKGAVYDLSGRRVAQPKKGLYIIDGKKVVIK